MKRLLVSMGFLLGLGALPGVMVVMDSLNETVGTRMDLQGCTATGPCLDLPRNADALRLSSTTQELCLTGSNLGEGGSFLVNGNPVEATQWPVEFAFVCLNVDPSIGSGFIVAVRNDGARSNQIPFIAQASVERWEIPQEVFPGDSLFVHGQNLRLSPVIGGSLQEVQRDDDRIEFVMTSPGIYEVSLDGVEGSEQEIRVIPRVERTCAAGPKTRCALLVSPMGRAPTVSVLVAGLEASVSEAEGTKIEFEWPEGLAPGEHPVALEVNGISAQAMVQKLESDRETLLNFSPSAGFIGPRASGLPTFDNQLVQTYFTHLTGSDTPQYGFNVLGRIPLDNTSRRLTSEGEFGYEQYLNLGDDLNTSQPPYMMVHGTKLLLLGKSATQNQLAITEFSVEDGVWSRQTSGGGTFFNFSRVAAARFFGENLVRMEGQTVSGAQNGVSFHGATISAQDEASLASLASLYDDTSVGWISSQAAFITTCGAPYAPAGLMRLDISEVDGEVQISNASNFLGDDPQVHMLACSGTDEGLYWVERRGGADRLVFLGNQAADMEVLAELPSEAPGVGDRYDLPRASANDPERWLPGLMVMRANEFGDVLLLHGVRDAEAPAIALMKWTRSTGNFSQAETLEVAMNAAAGELCLGPWPSDDRDSCGEVGQFGCNPMACDQRTSVPISRPRFQPWEADMLESGEDVHIFLTVARTGALEFAPFNRYELQYLKVKTP